MYVYIYIYCYRFPPVRRADDRLGPIAAARAHRTRNLVVTSGSTPKPSYGCFYYTTTLSMLCPRDRVDRRIVDLPNYSRGQTTERLSLDGACTKMSRLSSSFRMRLPSGFISPSPVGPDYFIGVKSQLIFRTQLWQSMAERDMTSRLHSTMGTFIWKWTIILGWL